MTGEQATAAGAVAADVAGEVTDLVAGVHRAVASRVFRYLGPVAAPVQATHDLVSRGVYASVRTGLRAGTRLAGHAAGRLRTPDTAPLDATPRGNVIVGIVNGVLGDVIEREAPALAIPMAVRAGHRDVAATRPTLAAAFPDATSQVAVFLHGLCETEDAWSLRSERTLGAAGLTVGDRLRPQGWTPVQVRYNTGRHISDSGADLATLLADLIASWPTPLTRLVLVGHSMGGLVARSACHQAPKDAAWLAATSDVVCLGSPHHGAPLEQVVNAGGRALQRFPESLAFDTFLRRRSAGIKDLRYGNVRREDWDGHDPDELLQDRRQAARHPERVRLHLVGATLGRRTSGLGALAGDVMVRFPSASGQHRRLALRAHRIHHVPSAGHLELLSHPRVLEVLTEVLADPAAADPVSTCGRNLA